MVAVKPHARRSSKFVHLTLIKWTLEAIIFQHTLASTRTEIFYLKIFC